MAHIGMRNCVPVCGEHSWSVAIEASSPPFLLHMNSCHCYLNIQLRMIRKSNACTFVLLLVFRWASSNKPIMSPIGRDTDNECSSCVTFICALRIALDVTAFQTLPPRADSCINGFEDIHKEDHVPRVVRIRKMLSAQSQRHPQQPIPLPLPTPQPQSRVRGRGR